MMISKSENLKIIKSRHRLAVICLLCIIFAIEMTNQTIGFDAKRIVSNSTGLGNYSRTLVGDLHREAPQIPMLLYALDRGSLQLRSQLQEDATLRFVFPDRPRLWVQRKLWRLRGIVDYLQRDGVTLYHGLTGELPFGLREAGIRQVVTVHDLIFLRHPKYYHRIDVQIYRKKFRWSMMAADRIIAISERTKQDIIELGGVDESRIDVVYQSCAPRFTVNAGAERLAEVSHTYSLPSCFVLSVGSIEERKNLELVVRALASLPSQVHLVAVGRPTKYEERLRDEALRIGVSQRIHLLHNVPNHDLQALYQMAQAFVYPSRYEGFGIPIIEAIHSGLPVVAATGSCLEEAGGPDCLYVSPDDHQAMARAITLLLSEGKESERIGRSREYVGRFSNANTARQVLQVYEKALL